MNGRIGENGFHNENERGGFFMRTKQWKKIGIIISLLALAAIALTGCSSGKDGATGPAGPAGPSAGTDAAVMSTETMAALNPTVTVDSVTISSPPVVKFTIKDAKGNGITGLGFTRLAATDALPTLMNLSFNLAKLVPANTVTGAPSKWVSYLVTTAPTKTTAGVAVPSVPTRPTTDTTGTLVDNGGGSYTYTFYRDITKIKDQVAAATFTGDNVLADLGDLTYDPKLTHRLVLRVSGNVRGTGNTTTSDNNNTADGKSSGIPAVPLENPKVIVYDFVPSTGKAVTSADTQREITTNAACASCHYVTPGHRGADVRNCVMCHNDQIKYGRAKTTSALAAGTYSTSTLPDATTGLAPGSMGVTGTKKVTTSTTTKDPLTGEYTTSTSYTPASYVIDGETLGNFPIMIHKLHMGNLLNRPAGRWDTVSGKVGPQWRGPLLKKTGYGYNLMGALAFQDMREYPLSPMNCRKCHVGETPAQLVAAPQANNWKTTPSRVACGACHDAINWTTGGGMTLAGSTSGHVGGKATDDSLCAVCHSDASTYHITEASTPLNPEVWSDAAGTMATITRYELDSVTVPAVAPFYPTVVFRIMEKVGKADWKPVTLNTLATASQGKPGVDGTGSAAMYAANSNTATGGARTGFSGGPSFLVHWSTTGGVDWDNFGSGNTRAYPGLPSAPTNAGVYLVDLITGTGGTISAPDATGHYTAVLMSANTHFSATGARPGAILTVAEAAALAAPTNPAIDQAFPAGAKLRTVQMLGNFGQRNLGAPYAGTAVTIPSPAVIAAVSGESRRSVFTMAKCQACHEAGYGNESDGGGHATPGDFASCITCHNPMMAGNGLDPTATAGFTRNNVKTPHGWNFKSLMHEKHAEANKMGSLNRCEKCHLTTASYSSVPAGALPTTIQVVYAAPGTGTVSSDLDLITSPYASACLACHSNPDAAAHATANGALVNKARWLGGTLGTNYSATVPLTKFVSTESCGTCHGVGKTYDVVKIHAAVSGD
jgi:OmcA/MtrC family decaheme c-type cytochrome